MIIIIFITLDFVNMIIDPADLHLPWYTRNASQQKIKSTKSAKKITSVAPARARMHMYIRHAFIIEHPLGQAEAG